MYLPAHNRSISLFIGLATLLCSWVMQGRATAEKPSLWLIGDSTVKNSTTGQCGWGEVIDRLFDPSKIKVENRAIGARSSRTYLSEGFWEKTLAGIQRGDFLLMQFGHNDAGVVTGEFAPGRPARASLSGNGEETQDAVVGTTGIKETVHTYGWYLRKYIQEAKARGATPIVLSLIPRNDWKDGKVLRASTSFGKWASEAAASEGVPFIDLNEIVANHYEELGEEKVKAFFPNEHTHTNVEGAELNAKCVVEGIQHLINVPLRDFLAPEPASAK